MPDSTDPILRILDQLSSSSGDLAARTRGANESFREAFTSTNVATARLRSYNQQLGAAVEGQQAALRAQREANEAIQERLINIEQASQQAVIGADDAAFQGIRSEDREWLQQQQDAGSIATQSYFREQELIKRRRELQGMWQAQPLTDKNTPRNRQAIADEINSVEIALSRNRDQRRATIPDQQYEQLIQSQNIPELYANKDGRSATSIPRNVVAGAVGGVGGILSLGLALLNRPGNAALEEARDALKGTKYEEIANEYLHRDLLSDFSKGVAKYTNLAVDAIDDQTLETQIQLTRAAQELEKGWGTGALSAVQQLGASGLIGIGEQMAGLALGGGLAGAGARVGARVLTRGASSRIGAATGQVGARVGQGTSIGAATQGDAFRNSPLTEAADREREAYVRGGGALALGALGAAGGSFLGAEGAIRTAGASLAGRAGSGAVGRVSGGFARGGVGEFAQEGVEAITDVLAQGIGADADANPLELVLDNAGSISAQATFGSFLGAPIGGVSSGLRTRPQQAAADPDPDPAVNQPPASVLGDPVDVDLGAPLTADQLAAQGRPIDIGDGNGPQTPEQFEARLRATQEENARFIAEQRAAQQAGAAPQAPIDPVTGGPVVAQPPLLPAPATGGPVVAQPPLLGAPPVGGPVQPQPDFTPFVGSQGVAPDIDLGTPLPADPNTPSVQDLPIQPDIDVGVPVEPDTTPFVEDGQLTPDIDVGTPLPADPNTPSVQDLPVQPDIELGVPPFRDDQRLQPDINVGTPIANDPNALTAEQRPVAPDINVGLSVESADIDVGAAPRLDIFGRPLEADGGSTADQQVQDRTIDAQGQVQDGDATTLEVDLDEQGRIVPATELSPQQTEEEAAAAGSEFERIAEQDRRDAIAADDTILELDLDEEGRIVPASELAPRQAEGDVAAPQAQVQASEQAPTDQQATVADVITEKQRNYISTSKSAAQFADDLAAYQANPEDATLGRALVSRAKLIRRQSNHDMNGTSGMAALLAANNVTDPAQVPRALRRYVEPAVALQNTANERLGELRVAEATSDQGAQAPDGDVEVNAPSTEVPDADTGGATLGGGAPLPNAVEGEAPQSNTRNAPPLEAEPLISEAAESLGADGSPEPVPPPENPNVSAPQVPVESPYALRSFTGDPTGFLTNYDLVRQTEVGGFVKQKTTQLFENPRTLIPAPFVDLPDTSVLQQRLDDMAGLVELVLKRDSVRAEGGKGLTLWRNIPKPDSVRDVTESQARKLAKTFVGNVSREDLPLGEFLRATDQNGRPSASPDHNVDPEADPTSVVGDTYLQRSQRLPRLMGSSLEANGYLPPLRVRPSVADIGRHIARRFAFGLRRGGIEILPPDAISDTLAARILKDTGIEYKDASAITYRGTIYINPLRTNSLEQLDITLTHEIIGHIGLRARFHGTLDKRLDEIFESWGGVDGTLKRADEMGINLRDAYAGLVSQAQEKGEKGEQAKRALVEELLSHMAETLPPEGTPLDPVKKLGAAVRSFIRHTAPQFAQLLDIKQVADWELAVMLGEASKAGYAVVNAGQSVDNVRAFAARTYTTRGHLNDQVDRVKDHVGESRQNLERLLRNGGPQSLKRRQGESARAFRTRKREGARAYLTAIADNENNWWNTFKKRWVNNRNTLHNEFRRWREKSAAQGGAFFKAAAISLQEWELPDSFNEHIGVDGQRVEVNGDTQTRTILPVANLLRTAIMRSVTGGRDLPQAAIPERLKDYLDISDAITLNESESGNLYVRDMQQVEGDLEASLGVLEAAIGQGARVSRGDAFDFANDALRALHAIERNRAWFYDPFKNRVLAEILTPAALAEAQTLYNRQFQPEANLVDIRAEVEAFIDANVPAHSTKLFEGAKRNVQSIGLTSRVARATLTEMGLDEKADNYSKARFEAVQLINEHLQTINAKANERKRSAGMSSSVLDTQIDYYNFDYYYPHIVLPEKGDTEATRNTMGGATVDVPRDTDFMSASRWDDQLMSQTAAAAGSTRRGVGALQAVREQAQRTYADVGDNSISERVFATWAAAIDNKENIAQVLDNEWDLATLKVHNKARRNADGTVPFVEEVLNRHNPQRFIVHLPPNLPLDPEMKAQFGNSGNIAFTLNFDDTSDIPLNVKGKRDVSQFLEELKQNHAGIYDATTGTTQFIGAMHTRYNFLNYPVRAVVRDTIQALATIGGQAGTEGLSTFRDGLSDAAKLSPKIAQYMYARAHNDKKNTARVAELRADEELADFIEFMDSGAIDANTRTFSMEGRHDDLVKNLRSKAFTTAEKQKLDKVDRSLVTLSILADVIPRYAAYRAQRKLGHSPQRAAAEARGLADFTQRGENRASDFGAMLYVFFRPALVGATQIVDTMLTSRYNLEATAVAGAMATALFGLGVMLAGDDDEGRNRFLAQGSDPTNYRLFLGDGAALSIPFGYNGFSAVTSATMQAMFTAFGDQPAVETLSNTFDIFSSTLSPVSNKIPITDPTTGELSFRQTATKIADLVTPTAPSIVLGLITNTTNFGAPIVRRTGASGSSVGQVFDATRGQIGTSAQHFTDFMFDRFNLRIPVGQVDYIARNTVSGLYNVSNSVLEGLRGFRDPNYEVDLKRLSLGLGGLIANPHNPHVSIYYKTAARARDILRSERFLINSGFSEADARQKMQEVVGRQQYDDLVLFSQLNETSGLEDVGAQSRQVRSSIFMTAEEKITRMRALSRETDSRIAVLFRRWEEAKQ